MTTAREWILERTQHELAEALRLAPAGDIQAVARAAAERLQARRLLREEGSLIPVYYLEAAE